MIDSKASLSIPGQFVDYFGSQLFVPAGHFAEQQMLRGEIAEPHVIGVLQRYLKPGDTVVDIGANIGLHSFAMASLVGPAGTVYAIEADLDIASATRLSILKSDASNIILLPVAASDDSGVVAAIVSQASNTVFSNSGAVFGGKFAACVTLDSVIADEVTLVKADIEGAELLAIRGFEKNICKNKPVVVCEFSPKYIAHTLGTDRSRELYAFFDGLEYDCSMIQWTGELLPIDGYRDLIRIYDYNFDTFGFGHIDIVFTHRAHSLN